MSEATAAEGDGAAHDASVEVVESNPSDERQANERTLGFEVQREDARRAVESAEAKLEKAQADVTAAQEAVAQANADLTELEGAV